MQVTGKSFYLLITNIKICIITANNIDLLIFLHFYFRQTLNDVKRIPGGLSYRFYSTLTGDANTETSIACQTRSYRFFKVFTIKMKKVTHQNFICDLIVLRYPQPTSAKIIIGIELRIRIAQACVGNKSAVCDT